MNGPVSNEAVILADVVPDDIVPVCGCTEELKKAVTGTVVVVGVIVLQDALDRSAVKIKTTPVLSVVCLVVVRLAELDDDVVCLPHPECDASLYTLLICRR